MDEIMGQAKHRGTKEQRVEQALDRERIRILERSKIKVSHRRGKSFGALALMSAIVSGMSIGNQVSEIYLDELKDLEDFAKGRRDGSF